jgi:hypothetical protein
MTLDPRWIRGTVVFLKSIDVDKFYGYIQPDGTTDRESRTWFGHKSCSGRRIEVDDVIYFERAIKELKGPRAYAVALAPETIAKRKLERK